MISLAAAVADNTPMTAMATSPQASSGTAGIRAKIRLLMMVVPAKGGKAVGIGFIDAFVSIVRRAPESLAHSPPLPRVGAVRGDRGDYAAGEALRDRPPG